MIKLTILDGRAVNPGDLPWDFLKKYADITVYERTSPEQVIERICNSDAILINKTPITQQILDACPNLIISIMTKSRFGPTKGIHIPLDLRRVTSKSYY